MKRLAGLLFLFVGCSDAETGKPPAQPSQQKTEVKPDAKIDPKEEAFRKWATDLAAEADAIANLVDGLPSCVDFRRNVTMFTDRSIRIPPTPDTVNLVDSLKTLKGTLAVQEFYFCNFIPDALRLKSKDLMEKAATDIKKNNQDFREGIKAFRQASGLLPSPSKPQ